MIDRDVEDKIKKTKEFMELWRKFHHLYKEASNKESIDPQEEETFLETKSLIARKYQALVDLLGMSQSLEQDRTFEVISQVLSLQGVSTLSDVQIQEIENGWHQSYIALNKILGSLENRRDALAKVSSLSVIVPKIFSALWKPGVRKTAQLLLVGAVIYVVGFRALHLDEKLRVFLSGFPPIQNILKFFPSNSEQE